MAFRQVGGVDGGGQCGSRCVQFAESAKQRTEYGICSQEVTIEVTAQSASQLLRLLWRDSLPATQHTRGPKQKVNVDAVVAAAVRIADEQGYAQVAIRTVAARLGLRPMSLYTYVPSKGALTELMVDAVAFEDLPIPSGLPLRARMSAIAGQFRSELLRHPWLLEVSGWRPVLGPGRSLRYERQLAALEESGLSDIELDHVLTTLSSFATGNARLSIAAGHSRAQVSDSQWWQIYGPLLEQIMPTAEFPVSARVGAAVGELYQSHGNPDLAYEFGLAKLLDGLAKPQQR